MAKQICKIITTIREHDGFINVWSDLLIAEIENVEGVARVNYLEFPRGNCCVIVDPRYDIEEVDREIRGLALSKKDATGR